MIRNGKIGLALTTCNRRKFFEICAKSVPRTDVSVVINDGAPYEGYDYTQHFDYVVQHEKNLGVTATKNDALKFLMDHDCEHLFIIEDDVFVTNNTVFEHYINTAKKTGIFHLNYAFHGPGNRDANGLPVSRKVVTSANGEAIISLNKNILAAFSYSHRSIIEKIGYIDTRYYNAWEHVDHTLQAIKVGLHPPFWWFADAANSFDYIKDQDDAHSFSVVRKNRYYWHFNMMWNAYKFKWKNGYIPTKIPDTEWPEVERILAQIKERYGQAD